MGRPLNKKYFGNRNIGSSSTSADNGIGGEGVASAAITVAGSYTTRPTFTFTAPQLPGGVTATGVVISEVLSATISGGTGYGNAQTFDLTVNTAGGTAVLNVTSTAGGAITTVNSITSRGTFTTLGPVTSISGGTGTGAVPVLTFRAKSVTITEKGSGYTASPTVAGYTNQGGITVNTIVLTTDSGSAGSTTNQENAIKVYAQTTSGGSRLVGDIIKQVNDRTYKVKTADGTFQKCKLRTDGGSGFGTCDITAYDSDGGEYWVWKLTSRKAVLVVKGSGGGSQFATGKTAKWVFRELTSGDANNTVKIDNA